MPNEPNKGKNSAVIVVIVLLICAVVAGWLVLRSRTPNMPPVAAVRLDSLDVTNRVATISDDGSQDPDGTLRSWRIAWGDGKEDNLAASPQKAAHAYGSEGNYTISLWCVDNQGATSSVPAITNITFDFLKRQKALEQAEAEAKLQAEAKAKAEADRLKAEQARKEAERLEQERQKEMAAQEARKASEQQELEKKRMAEAELARQKREEAAKASTSPRPTPLAAALPDNPWLRKVIYTPRGYTLGDFEIQKEKTEGMQPDGKLLVTLAIRCVNFPDTPVATSWQLDGKDVQVRAGRIRASLSPGRHQVGALLARKAGSGPMELKADATVGTKGDCVVEPRK